MRQSALRPVGIRPEDAIGVPLRVGRAILGGGSQQLPPTSFFERGVDEDESAAEGLESIPDTALAHECRSTALSSTTAAGANRSSHSPTATTTAVRW